MDFLIAADHRVKLKESEKRDKYLDLARDLKKQWNMKVMVVPIVISALGTGTRGLGNKRISGDHQNYNIFETDQNAGKGPGDFLLLRLQ